MAVTVSDIRTQFYEFSSATITDAMIQNRIDVASELVSEDFYGSKTDMAITWLTAHLISQSQFGEDNAQKNQSETSVYKIVFDSISKTIPARGMVL